MKAKKPLCMLLILSFLMTLIPVLSVPAYATGSDPASYIFDISEGDITVSSGTAANMVKVTYGASQTPTPDFPDSQGITITGTSTEHKVLVNLTNSANVANISLNKADIQFGTGDNCAFQISSGTVFLTLEGTSTLKSSGSFAGVKVQGDNAVIIGGSGTLNATGGLFGVTEGSEDGGSGIGSAGHGLAHVYDLEPW